MNFEIGTMKLLIFLTLIAVCYSSEDICAFCKCSDKKMDCSKTKEDITSLMRKYGSTSIEEFVVRNNHIPKLARTFFRNWPNLKKISITNCKITEISDFTFNSLSFLYEINLSGNLLKWLKPNTFKGATSLEVLNIAGNHLTSLPILDNPNIKKLILANNKLTDIVIPDDYKLLHLEELNLSANPITKLTKETFESLLLLKRLYLRSCPINEVETGAFQIPNLEVLQMGGGMQLISEVLCPIFQDLKNNKFVSMKMTISLSQDLPHDCQFPPHVTNLNLLNSHIKPRLLKALLEPMRDHLSQLILDNCFLNGVNNLQFPLMKSLKILTFKRNVIKYLPDGFFAELPNLEQLCLTRSSIRAIEENAFDGLIKLKQLDLSRNRKLTFSLTMISGLNLESLDLSHTQLSSSINSCTDFKKMCVKFSANQKVAGCQLSKKKQCSCHCVAGKSSPIIELSKSNEDKEKKGGLNWISTGFLVIFCVMGVVAPGYFFRQKIRRFINLRRNGHHGVQYNATSGEVSLPHSNSELDVQVRMLPECPNDAPSQLAILPTSAPESVHIPLEEERIQERSNVLSGLPRSSLEALNRFKHHHHRIPTTPPPLDDPDSSTYESIAGTQMTTLPEENDLSSNEELSSDRVVSHLGEMMNDFNLDNARDSSSIGLNSSNDHSLEDPLVLSSQL